MLAGECGIVFGGPSVWPTAALTAVEVALGAVQTISLLVAAMWIVSLPDLIDLTRRRVVGARERQGRTRTA
jgi:hypothetical protein